MASAGSNAKTLFEKCSLVEPSLLWELVSAALDASATAVGPTAIPILSSPKHPSAISFTLPYRPIFPRMSSSVPVGFELTMALSSTSSLSSIIIESPKRSSSVPGNGSFASVNFYSSSASFSGTGFHFSRPVNVGFYRKFANYNLLSNAC